MALKNPNTNEYLRIREFHFNDNQNSFMYDIFLNQEQRQIGDTEYIKHKEGSHTSEIFDNLINANEVNLTESLKNNLKIKSYLALKQTEFTNWIDC